ncbi:MAG TPA: hypothetical protein DDZ89_00905 [Clostridiales bacterium]|nr:hypothetical protein [Clostridiales bacterium]
MICRWYGKDGVCIRLSDKHVKEYFHNGPCSFEAMISLGIYVFRKLVSGFSVVNENGKDDG